MTFDRVVSAAWALTGGLILGMVLLTIIKKISWSTALERLFFQLTAVWLLVLLLLERAR